MGGGPFGGNANLTEALDLHPRARRRHGRGLQPAGRVEPDHRSGYDVAALGGFSGRESEVSVQWLAEAVKSGRIRWVLTGGDGGFGGQDGRVGSSKVMAAVEKAGTEVDSVSGLYDLQGKASALLAAS